MFGELFGGLFGKKADEKREEPLNWHICPINAQRTDLRVAKVGIANPNEYVNNLVRERVEMKKYLMLKY